MIIVKKTFFSISLLVAVLAIASPVFVFAATPATITISPNIPGVYNVSTAGPCGWIVNFYTFALIISGILAFGAIVFGGVKYATSAGNPSAQSEGRSWILSALLGLLLLGGAYLILYTINPGLTKCSLPTLSALPAVAPTAPTSTPPTPTPTSTCPLTPLTLPTDPQALAMANGNGQTILWTSSNPSVQQNLNALQAAYGKLNQVLTARGDSITVNSVYRPLAYQAYLYNIYQTATQLAGNPNDSSIAACSATISALQAAEQLHGVCNQGGPCLVAAPTGCAPHVEGIGIDLTLQGPVGDSAANAILQSNNVGIQFQALSGDPVHFQLTNPPVTSCASS